MIEDTLGEDPPGGGKAPHHKNTASDRINSGVENTPGEGNAPHDEDAPSGGNVLGGKDAPGDETAPSGRDYPIGYKKPPKANQFQPKKSGNPRGRSRKGRPKFQDIFFEVFSENVMVNEGAGKGRRMPRLEAFVRRLVDKAMRGDAAAIKLVLSIFLLFRELNSASETTPAYTADLRRKIEDMAAKYEARVKREKMEAERDSPECK